MASNKLAQDRLQKQLLDLAAQPGNDVCADCKARNPRWASHNLGIFICVSCASIHRKMGTHISKVKSLTLDSWSKEQVETMKQIGNTNSNFVFNPNERRHPPPINAIDQERDSELEKFIRSKYEFKQYVDRAALVASKLGPSRSASSRLASGKSETKLTPSSTASTISSSTSTSAPAPPSKPAAPPPVAKAPVTIAPPPSAPPVAPSIPASGLVKAPLRSVSQPVPAPLNLPPTGQAAVALGSVTFSGLGGQQSAISNATLPLQYVTPQLTSISMMSSPMTIPTIPTNSPMSLPTTSSPMTIPSSLSSSSFLGTPSPYSNLSASPHSPFPSTFAQTTGISPGVTNRSMSLGTGLTAHASLSAQMSGLSLGSGGASPYQQLQPLPQASPAASPNPYAPQMLPGVGAGLSPSYNAMGGQQMYANQQMQQPAQMFAPQPMQQSLQVPNSGNPYMPSTTPQGSPFAATQFTSTTPSPYAMTQPLPYTTQPSPFAATHPLPQMQQQQPQTQTNPFTSWIAQGPQQTGYPGQQQW